MDTWVYHKTESPKLVMSAEAEELYKDGWADTPAKFIKGAEAIVESVIEKEIDNQVLDAGLEVARALRKKIKRE